MPVHRGRPARPAARRGSTTRGRRRTTSGTVPPLARTRRRRRRAQVPRPDLGPAGGSCFQYGRRVASLQGMEWARHDVGPATIAALVVAAGRPVGRRAARRASRRELRRSAARRRVDPAAVDRARAHQHAAVGRGVVRRHRPGRDLAPPRRDHRPGPAAAARPAVRQPGRHRARRPAGRDRGDRPGRRSRSGRSCRAGSPSCRGRCAARARRARRAGRRATFAALRRLRALAGAAPYHRAVRRRGLRARRCSTGRRSTTRPVLRWSYVAIGAVGLAFYVYRELLARFFLSLHDYQVDARPPVDDGLVEIALRPLGRAVDFVPGPVRDGLPRGQGRLAPPSVHDRQRPARARRPRHGQGARRLHLAPAASSSSPACPRSSAARTGASATARGTDRQVWIAGRRRRRAVPQLAARARRAPAPAGRLLLHAPTARRRSPRRSARSPSATPSLHAHLVDTSVDGRLTADAGARRRRRRPARALGLHVRPAGDAAHLPDRAAARGRAAPAASTASTSTGGATWSDRKGPVRRRTGPSPPVEVLAVDAAPAAPRPPAGSAGSHAASARPAQERPTAARCGAAVGQDPGHREPPSTWESTR